jgi:hypothetical protein
MHPLLVHLGLAVAAVTAKAPASPSPWSTLAREDLEAIHRAVLENHPGPVDSQNPGFHVWLESGYRQSLEHARRARSFQGYTATLRRYVAGFRDGHLSIGFRASWDDVRWPGFLVSLRGGRYLVAEADPTDSELPPDGAEVLDCDGKGLEWFLDRDVFPYEGNPALEASRVSVAPMLLVDWGFPDTPPIKQCRVRVHEAIRTFDLRQRDIDSDELRRKRQRAAFGPRPPFAVRPFGSNGVWVTLPSFENGDATVKALQEAIDQAPGWRTRDLIVFDVRGNEGGSSRWGSRLIHALWGEPFARMQEKLAEAKDEYVEWRASPGNVAVLESALADFRRRMGPGAGETRWADRMASLLKRGVASKKTLVREPESDEPHEVSAGTEQAPPNPVRGRIFLLTDGRCYSACLDFADMLLPFPGVTHVGSSTGADSLYMEARLFDLPSGVGVLQLPMKVYRGRPRGSNVPYVPKVRFDGDMADSAALERWIQSLETNAESDQRP